MARKKLDPVTDYARKVTAGKIVAGRLVRLACERHLDDLKKGPARGLFFDVEEVEFVISFFEEFLKHSKGKWAGENIKLEPWQKFRLGSIFGWKTADGLRRFRTAYNQVARKNGKSTEAAGIGLYGLTVDGEAGAEIYSAATTRDQARIVFAEAVRMVKKSPELAAVIGIFKNNLSIEETDSKFEPLSSEDSTLDGLNIHFAIIDELHAHKTSGVWDVLDSGTGSREQPLIYAITTAGFDAAGICYDTYTYAREILEGVQKDDSFFAYIAQLDDADDWADPKVWIKANPNLGVSAHIKSLESAARKARSIPSALNNFLVKHLNMWASSATRWISPDIWQANKGKVNPKELEGLSCYGGLDLSDNTDLSAFVLAFPVNGKIKLLVFLYLPEEGIAEREKRDNAHYRDWAKKGFLTLTPGNFVDYAFIKHDILEAAKKYDIKEIAFDRYRASRLTQELAEEGLNLVMHGQGFASMHAPSTEFMNLLVAMRIEHGGNEALGWNAANVVVRKDPAGNIKPDKERSRKRIDGIVAGIMAVGRAIFAEGEEDTNARGLIELED